VSCRAAVRYTSRNWTWGSAPNDAVPSADDALTIWTVAHEYQFVADLTWMVQPSGGHDTGGTVNMLSKVY